MSNQLGVATVTAAIERLLNGPLGAEVGGANAIAARPRSTAADLDSDPGISVFLFGIGPRTAYTPGGEDLPTRRSNGQLAQRPRTTLELNYLLIAYGDPVRHEPERLLAVAARELHAHPIVDRGLIDDLRNAADPPPPAAPVHPHLAQTDLDDETELVKLTVDNLDLSEQSNLWSALQAPYAPSLYYRASVVSIDAETTASPPLPVLERALYTVPLRAPVIDTVVSSAGNDEPIFATSTIVVSGSNLRGDVTLVRLSGDELTPGGVSNTAITMPLSSAPPGSLRPGPQVTQVVQQHLMGSPPVPHNGIASNQVVFSLHPSVMSAVTQNVTPAGSLFDGEVLVEVDLTVEGTQPAVLRLSDLANERIAYRIASPERTDDSTHLPIPFIGVAAGTYLVQVEIAGAESQIDRDASGAPTGPTLVVP